MPQVPILGPVSDPSLSQMLTPAQYQAIHAGVQTAKNSAMCYSCCIEWTLCLVAGVWCIFCCHACIQNCFEESTMRGEMNNLNLVLFNGMPVLSVANQQVYVNTDIIPRQTQTIVVQPGIAMGQMPGQPMMMVQQPGQPMYAQPGQPQYAQVAGQPQYAPVGTNPGQVYPAPVQYAQVEQPQYVKQ